MNERDHKVLESYLNTLDRSLKHLSVSDKAEIITEIKGHVLDTLDRENQRGLDSVLASLGEAETVANKYLMERGLSPGKPSKTPIVKWLTIGFLGTVAMCLIFTALTMAFFSPLIEIDDAAGRIRLLGGLIDISDSKTNIEISSKSQVSKSILSMTPDMTFNLVFNNGKIDIVNSNSDIVSWNCKMDGSSEPIVTTVDKVLTLDLSKSMGAKCEIEIPAMKEFLIVGVNGKIEYTYPRVDSMISLANGKIDFEFDENVDYNHDVKVGKGFVKGLPPSISTGVSLKVDLANGMVDGNN